MAKALDLSLSEYQKLLGQVSHLGCVSLNETLDSSAEGSSFLDALVDKRSNASPVNRLEDLELTQTVAKILSKLPEKERLVISLYYYEELTQKEIAEVLCVSEGRISQLHSQALINLRNKVKSQIF
jgi:RNA polymerase sigma factor FliA